MHVCVCGVKEMEQGSKKELRSTGFFCSSGDGDALKTSDTDTVGGTRRNQFDQKRRETHYWRQVPVFFGLKRRTGNRQSRKGKREQKRLSFSLPLLSFSLIWNLEFRLGSPVIRRKIPVPVVHTLLGTKDTALQYTFLRHYLIISKKAFCKLSRHQLNITMTNKKIS